MKRIIVLALVLGCLITACFVLDKFTNLFTGTEKVSVDTKTIHLKTLELKRLEVISEEIAVTIDSTSVKEFAGGDWNPINWFPKEARRKSVRITAAVRITAGIDLSRLRPDDFTVSDGGILTVKLPPAQLFSVEVMDSSMKFDDFHGVFRRRDKSLAEKSFQLLKDKARASAAERQLLARADSVGAIKLRELWSTMGARKSAIVPTPQPKKPETVTDDSKRPI